MHAKKNVQSMGENLVAPWLTARGAPKQHVTGLHDNMPMILRGQTTRYWSTTCNRRLNFLQFLLLSMFSLLFVPWQWRWVFEGSDKFMQSPSQFHALKVFLRESSGVFKFKSKTWGRNIYMHTSSTIVISFKRWQLDLFSTFPNILKLETFLVIFSWFCKKT